jgi:hypothetical protein
VEAIENLIKVANEVLAYKLKLSNYGLRDLLDRLDVAITTAEIAVGSPIANDYESINLRDYFAGKAVSGFDCGDYTAEKIATYAYKIADAMLKERMRLEMRC